MVLVKQLGGINDGDGDGAVSPSSPESFAASAKRSKTVEKVGQDVTLKCTVPVPVDFHLHPKYFGNVKGPWCVHCYNIKGKRFPTNAPIVCLTCGKGLCRKHWMESPPHRAYYEANGINVDRREGEI